MKAKENNLIHGVLPQNKWEVDRLDQMQARILQDIKIGIFSQVLIPKNFSGRFLVKQVFKEGILVKILLNPGLGLGLPRR